MGYETKLIIGKESSFTEPEHEQESDFVLAGEYAWRPYKKDEKGQFIPTGRTRTYFSTYAMINLCKCGDTHLHDLDWTNEDKDHDWYWFFDGNTEETTDCYGVRPRPVPVEQVLDALKKDLIELPDYRRLQWAIGLLEAMVGDDEGLQVLIYGY